MFSLRMHHAAVTSFLAALVGSGLLYAALAGAQPRGREGWGDWGYESRPERQRNFCPDCGRPWGPYGGYGLDPQDRWGRTPRMAPEEEGRRSYRPDTGDYEQGTDQGTVKEPFPGP